MFDAEESSSDVGNDDENSDDGIELSVIDRVAVTYRRKKAEVKKKEWEVEYDDEAEEEKEEEEEDGDDD